MSAAGATGPISAASGLVPSAWHPGQVDALTGTARLLGSALRPVSTSAARLHLTAADPALRAGWHGPAADAAARALRRRAVGVGSVATALDLAAQSLARAAAAVTAAGWRAARAAAAGPALIPGLSVPGLAWAEAELAEASVQVRAASTTCAAALLEAADRCRGVVRGVAEPSARARAVSRLGPARAAAWLATVPPAGTGAGQVAQWWAAHTSAEQRQLASGRATAVAVGSLDGVPARARDRANRAVLARRLAGWAGAEPGTGTPVSPAAAAAHAVDLRLLDELSRLRLDPATGSRVPILLTTYDPTAWGGRGRVAVAFGSPDDADHVAYVVPGLGARADPDLDGLAAGAWQLYSAARRLAARPSVATVAWLGYQTPDLAEVAFEQRAQDGAERLCRELAGLRAARADVQPHVTVVGHSYGSVVAALTTRALPGAVDDLAAIGSPGVTVDRAGDLPVPDGHVWVGAASGDPVSHLSMFGLDPAAQSFGAHRFPAETGAGMPPLAQHSHYLDAGGPSLAALARIVAGRGGEVATAPGRTDSGYAGGAADLLLPLVLLGLLHREPEPTFGDPAAG